MKKGQKVWFIDHFSDELKEGMLVSIKNQSSLGDIPTFYVKDNDGMLSTSRVLEDWIFTTKKAGKTGMKKYLQQKIDRKKAEINALRRKLK